MTNHTEDEDLRDLGEEEATARLLRLAGAATDTSPERAARVRAPVHQAWQAQHRRRAMVRRAAFAGTVLAAAATLALVVRVSTPRESTAPAVAERAATAERIEGAPVLRRMVGGRLVASPVSPNTSLREDDLVETDGASRVAWRTPDGSSVRLDNGARARLLSATVIDLLEGAVYVATSDTSKGFEVRTPMGTLRDVGTQFEVRFTGSSLRLRVRAGRVEVRRGAEVIPTSAGTEVTVAATGVRTSTMSVHGSAWEWTASVAPVFEIEGRPLSTFLEHVAREEGWVLRYADPALARAASSIIMRGSIGGVRAEEALRVALATSGLQHRLQEGELVVSRPAAGR
jgi:ferric-dicitrate binding protein FerR (iron transport regulator)